MGTTENQKTTKWHMWLNQQNLAWGQKTMNYWYMQHGWTSKTLCWKKATPSAWVDTFYHCLFQKQTKLIYDDSGCLLKGLK